MEIWRFYMKRTLTAFLTLIAAFLSISATQAADKKMDVSIDVGYNHPLHDLSELAERGFGFHATFEYYMNPRLSVYGSAGYHIWSTILDYELSYMGYTADAELKIGEIPLKVGGRYYFAEKGFRPFAGIGVGAHLIRSKWTVSYEGPILGEISDDYTENRTEFGISPHFGFKYELSEKMDFTANLKYTFVTSKSFAMAEYTNEIAEMDDSVDKITFGYLSVNLGICIGL